MVGSHLQWPQSLPTLYSFDLVSVYIISGNVVATNKGEMHHNVVSSVGEEEIQAERGEKKENGIDVQLLPTSRVVALFWLVYLLFVPPVII